ncbi:MAG: motility associated factor glycosyltransferase family protein [Lachnospiraceae bacterium]
MGEYFDENLKVFLAKYTIQGEAYKKYLEQNIDTGKIKIEYDRNNKAVFAIEQNNHKWYLDSRYNSEEMAGFWEKEYADVNYASIFCVFGLGNGEKIRALHKVLKENANILIYEPDVEIFHCAMNYCNLADVLSDNRVVLCVKQLQDTLMMDALFTIMNYGRINHTKLISLPGYDKLYNEELTDFIKDIKDTYNSRIITSNTSRVLGREMNEQFFKNVRFILQTSTIDIVKGKILAEGYDKYPAILVAGGPSLDGNVEELKRAVGKCFIFCVDTAIRALLKRDIIPDAIITIDSHKPMELFEDERVKYLPMVGCYQTRHEILENHQAKVIMFPNNDYIKKLYKTYGRELRVLQTAGSVANTAFAFIEEIGIKDIILIGQDCAFTGNKLHTADGYKEKPFEVTEGMYLVEGNDGEMVYTNHVYDGYRKFFEKEIRRNSHINVINATEGGAKINGATVMTLKDAIDKYCTERVDFKSFLDSVDNSYYGEEYEKIKADLYDLPKRFEQLSDTLEQYMKKYQLVKEKAVRNSVTKEDLQEFLKEVDSFNDIVENDSLMSIVTQQASVVEHEVLEHVNESCDDLYKDVLDICEKGIQVIEAYQKEIPDLKQAAENIFN